MKFRYVRMIVADNLRGKTIEQEVKENISPGSVVKTDNYKSYSRLKDYVWRHIPQTVKPEQAEKILPWVPTMISNAKRTLLGMHHMISMKYGNQPVNHVLY